MKTMKSRRSGGAERGGIRKRGPMRTDRDGDMDMDRGGARGGKRPRGETGRAGGRSTAGGRPLARDKTLDAIQKAISSSKDSQANIRQIKSSSGASLEQFSVRGWKQSKAASNRDGGVESLIAFLERRMNATTKSGPRAKITKVCQHLEGPYISVSASPAPACSRNGWSSRTTTVDTAWASLLSPLSGDRDSQGLMRLTNLKLVAGRRRLSNSFRPPGPGGPDA